MSSEPVPSACSNGVNVETSGPVFSRPFVMCEVSGDSKTDDLDKTPEYPLPSPTNPFRQNETSILSAVILTNCSLKCGYSK